MKSLQWLLFVFCVCCLSCKNNGQKQPLRIYPLCSFVWHYDTRWRDLSEDTLGIYFAYAIVEGDYSNHDSIEKAVFRFVDTCSGGGLKSKRAVNITFYRTTEDLTRNFYSRGGDEAYVLGKHYYNDIIMTYNCYPAHDDEIYISINNSGKSNDYINRRYTKHRVRTE